MHQVVRQEDEKVKRARLRADAKLADGLPLTITEIAARYHEGRPAVAQRFASVEPDGKVGQAFVYSEATIRRVMSGATV